MFLRVVEAVVYALFLYGVFTQLFLPLWKGTPLFPVFRHTHLNFANQHERLQIAAEKEEWGEVESIIRNLENKNDA